jgi:hypothetical protein
MNPPTSSDDEDRVWLEVGRRHFEAAYAPEDAIYDQLLDQSEDGIPGPHES